MKVKTGSEVVGEAGVDGVADDVMAGTEDPIPGRRALQLRVRHRFQ
jgi:hypothetical protein